jgi:hypothetical protein
VITRVPDKDLYIYFSEHTVIKMSEEEREIDVELDVSSPVLL